MTTMHNDSNAKEDVMTTVDYSDARDFIQEIINAYGGNKVINTLIIDPIKLNDFIDYKVSIESVGHVCHAMITRLTDSTIYVITEQQVY